MIPEGGESKTLALDPVALRLQHDTSRNLSMSPFTLIKISLRALLRNRMRTFLSVLGIVIDVAAVITMVAMGEGSKKSIKEQMTAMGTNAIIIMPNRDRRGGVQMESTESLE